MLDRIVERFINSVKSRILKKGEVTVQSATIKSVLREKFPDWELKCAEGVSLDCDELSKRKFDSSDTQEVYFCEASQSLEEFSDAGLVPADPVTAVQAIAKYGLFGHGSWGTGWNMTAENGTYWKGEDGNMWTISCQSYSHRRGTDNVFAIAVSRNYSGTVVMVPKDDLHPVLKGIPMNYGRPWADGY